MWPLLFFSILSFSCIVERIIFWNKLNHYVKVNNDFQINEFTDISYLKSLKKKDIDNNPYKKLLNFSNSYCNDCIDIDKAIERFL